MTLKVAVAASQVVSAATPVPLRTNVKGVSDGGSPTAVFSRSLTSRLARVRVRPSCRDSPASERRSGAPGEVALPTRTSWPALARSRSWAIRMIGCDCVSSADLLPGDPFATRSVDCSRRTGYVHTGMTPPSCSACSSTSSSTSRATAYAKSSSSVLCACARSP
jgi:hypothetical protein